MLVPRLPARDAHFRKCLSSRPYSFSMAESSGRNISHDSLAYRELTELPRDSMARLETREKADMPEKLRPNAFVSVRIPSVQIREKLKEVQDAMLSCERKLKSTFVPLEKLHLTLMVLRLEDTEMVEK